MKMFFKVLFLLSFLLSANAQITITSPDTADVVAGYCPDYFREEWGTGLDMNDAESGVLSDIPTLQVSNTDSYKYTNGIMSFTTTSSNPTNVLLQYKDLFGAVPVGTRYGIKRRINTGYYKVLSFKMYSSVSGTGEVIWYSNSIANTGTRSFQVKEGTHVYSLDLEVNQTVRASPSQNTTWSSSQVEGLALHPVAGIVGAEIKYDWIRLTPRTPYCQDFSISYNATASGGENYSTIFIDNDSDLKNGYVLKKTDDATGADSQAFSTQLLPPGKYKVSGILSGDYATNDFYNPYDMNDISDIKKVYTVDGKTLDTAKTFYRLSNPQFIENSGNFEFSATTNDSDPSFKLNVPIDSPLNTDSYSKMTVKINYSGVTTDMFQAFFSANGVNYPTPAIAITNGDNILTFDLSTLSSLPTFVDTIQIDPAFFSGVTFKIDYISFHNNNYPTSLSYPTVVNANKDVEIKDLAFNFGSPDKRGGREFSQTVLGNPWLMNDADDLGPAFNISSAAFLPYTKLQDPAGIDHYGDFFKAYNIPNAVPNNGDPLYHSLNYDASFDPNEFVNICFRGWNEIENPSRYNSVARILWQDPREGSAASSYKNGDDIIMTRAANEYCLDMREDAIIEPALPAGAPNPWTSIGTSGNRISYFRIDLNENENTNGNPYYYSVFDYIFLRTDHEANASFAISVDAPLSQVISLYSNTSKSTSGGTLIGTLAVPRNSNVFKWNTSSVADGSYYIYGVSAGNGNTYSRLADGRIKVDHSRATDTSNPILVCDRPSAGYSTNAVLEVAGYALDETRLASLEFLIDNVYYDSFLPHKFNKTARDTYSNLSGTNNAGFQKFYDISSYSAGTHSYKIIATDTTGNETNCTGNFDVSAASPPSPLVDPTPSDDFIPVAVPTATPTPVPTATPVPSVTLSASSRLDTVTLRVSNTTNCPSVRIAASRNINMTKPIILSTKLTRSANLTLAANKVPTYRVNKGDKDEDGLIYLQAICASSRSSIVRLSGRLIKNKRSRATESGIITYLRRNLK